MSNLKKWGKLNAFYKATNRKSIVNSLHKGKPIRDSWRYWAAGVFYFVGSVSSFLVFLYFQYSLFLWIIVFIPMVLMSNWWLESLIAKEFESYYQHHNLMSHPFYLRTEYLSYLLFTEMLNEERDFDREKIISLVEWETIRQDKINRLDFFQSPVVVVTLTLVAGLLLGYFKEESLTIEILSNILILIFAVLFMVWILLDSLKSQTIRNLEICRFLKWWAQDQ